MSALAAALSPAGELTAVRTWSGSAANPKAKVTVYLNGEMLDELGGKRAERAGAALVSKWGHRERCGVWGLRKDLDAARTEAHRLATMTEMRTRGKYGRPGSVIPLNHAEWARAVPVVEG